MIISKFISIFRWRVIVLHLLAAWCFVMATQMLFFIKYGEITILTERFTVLEKWPDNISLARLVVWAFYFPYLGLLLAFVVSMIIARKLRINFLNAAIVLIVGFVSIRFFWLFWKNVKWQFFDLGNTIFNNMLLEFILKTAIFLVIGNLFFLFSYRYEKKKAAIKAAL